MKKSAGYVTLMAVSRMLLGIFGAGCATYARSTAVSESQEIQAQGPAGADTSAVVEYVWEEPMVDTIDVPPGLDPEGHYYRPAHKSVVEIRQGRWRHYREPGS